ncbi:competence protein ComK [Cytobacillus sp. Hz8]|uniref:competence protein ComK n=1 Tax=Cytobacillus sp. Hz8 TaxID=3347168 RepID=UPI0035DC4FC5
MKGRINKTKEGLTMKIRNNYLINEKTVLFYGEWNENGELFTFVIEGDDSFLVSMSPIKLIDKSLLSYGSNFIGALRSSRELLGGNRKMYPIKIDASLDIWLFPTKSYKKENCVWFALSHVKYTKRLGNKHTKVFLSYGHEFEIEMGESSFRNKRDITLDLRNIIYRNTKKSLNYVAVSQKQLIILEQEGQFECKSNN